MPTPNSPNETEMLYYCALSYGNLTCLVNDTLAHPQLVSPFPQVDSIAPPNADLVIVLIGGLPVPFLVAVRLIKAGHEVCYAYGPAYWNAWRSLRSNTARAAELAAAMRGGGEGKRGNSNHTNMVPY